MQILVEVSNPKFGTYYLEQKGKKRKNTTVLEEVRVETKENELQQEFKSKGHSLK